MIKVITIKEDKDGALRKICKPVKNFEKAQGLIQAMLDYVKEFHRNTAGLAAPQVGSAVRIIVVDFKTGQPPIVMVNPMVSKPRGSTMDAEGCLSLPGQEIRIKRPKQITVRYFNRYGKPCKMQVRSMHARIVSHEVDHLNGILITDHEWVAPDAE